MYVFLSARDGRARGLLDGAEPVDRGGDGAGGRFSRSNWAVSGPSAVAAADASDSA